MASAKDIGFMARALELARRARGFTSPNPMVGAVIVKRGKIVGEGYHRVAGGDHAEVEAIRMAGKASRGATIYVTLEPCCHVGRTGPCTQAIIQSGIKKVFFAVKDPDLRVAGKGARQLRRAGVEVSLGLLRKESLKFNEAYFHFKKTGRPFVVLKAAQTLDGRLATISGDSKWISCEETLGLAHQLRADVDAVVVGMGTVLADNPSLTVRRVRGRNPYRIVLSANPRLSRTCNLIAQNDDYRTIIASTKSGLYKIPSKSPVRDLILWQLRQTRSGQIDLSDFILKAGEFGIQSILIEGGAMVHTSFLKAHLVDKLVLITAPKLIGSGIETIGDLGIKKIDNAITFNDAHFENIGSDCVFTGYPRWDI